MSTPEYPPAFTSSKNEQELGKRFSCGSSTPSPAVPSSACLFRLKLTPAAASPTRAARVCPAFFPARINSGSLIPNGPFWHLPAVPEHQPGLAHPCPRSRVSPPCPAQDFTPRESSQPNYTGSTPGKLFHHTHTFFFFFPHTQVSEFNTAATIPLLFKGTIFPFISSPLYIITLSKLCRSCSAPAGDKEPGESWGVPAHPPAHPHTSLPPKHAPVGHLARLAGSQGWALAGMMAWRLG